MEESVNEKDEVNKKVSFTLQAKFYPVWSFIAYGEAVSSQFHRYYQYGDFLTCDKEKENMKLCLWYMMKRTPEGKAKLLAATKEIDDFLNFVHKPSSSVWEFRENPAADWLKKE